MSNGLSVVDIAVALMVKVVGVHVFRNVWKMASKRIFESLNGVKNRFFRTIKQNVMKERDISNGTTETKRSEARSHTTRREKVKK